MATGWPSSVRASLRSTVMVCTLSGSALALVEFPEGRARSLLLSSSGVVIIKITSSTKHRSSIGVTLISLRVCRPSRWEKRRIGNHFIASRVVQFGPPWLTNLCSNSLLSSAAKLSICTMSARMLVKMKL